MSAKGIGKKKIADRDKAIDKYAPGQLNGGVITYPAIFDHLDKRDENWQIKHAASAAGWDVPLTDSDVEWIKSKKQVEETKSYDRFMQEIWPAIRNDPVNAKFAEETWPELFELRREWARNQQEIQYKLFDINLKGGPTTKDEFELVYKIRKGQITVHPVSVHLPVANIGAQAGPRRGAFNPNRGITVGLNAGGIPQVADRAAFDNFLVRPGNIQAYRDFVGTQ
jgi:hypothetical protein